MNIKSSWNDLTWREYEQLEQIINADIPEAYKTTNIVALLTGKTEEEIDKMPVSEFQKLLPALDFLKEEPELREVQDRYTINDREYIFRGKIEEITTAQYIDYTEAMKAENRDVVRLVSCFLIPAGHDYNDGYCLETVWSDIESLCWLDIRAISFFFRVWSATYILTLKSYLKKMMKKEKKQKKKIKEMETQLDSLAWSLLYAESVK